MDKVVCLPGNEGPEDYPYSFRKDCVGEQKIVFNKYGNSTHVHDKIIESFSVLAGAGGYEVLRVSDDKTKNLMEIPMSANGYSISYLKGEFHGSAHVQAMK